MTHYEILHVPPRATLDEIHQSYIRLAAEHAPRMEGDPEDTFRNIAASWGVLKNVDTRTRYDNELKLKGCICGACEGLGTKPGMQNGKFNRKAKCKSCGGKGLK